MIYQTEISYLCSDCVSYIVKLVHLLRGAYHCWKTLKTVWKRSLVSADTLGGCKSLTFFLINCDTGETPQHFCCM